MLAAIADGVSEIHGYSAGADAVSTLRCLRSLGVPIEDSSRSSIAGADVSITGVGIHGLREPAGVLDAGNSGSTMRMLAGILAAQPFCTTVTGDASLRQRPMERIIVPLERMGARVTAIDQCPPLEIEGTAQLTAIDFQPEMPSAQVKSAVLLAGLHAKGVTRVHEPIQTRDHTERALQAFGAEVNRTADVVSVAGGQRLHARELVVPGDLSSAVFWMVAAAALPDSQVTIERVGLNPTRLGVLNVLRRLGASVDVHETITDAAGEPMGTIVVTHQNLLNAHVDPHEIPGVIDELPALAALATHGGALSVSGAGELRVKESDRISALAEGFRCMGADIEEQPDGFRVLATRQLRGGEVNAHNDHRLVMAFAVAALGASGPTTIVGADASAVSYPEFFSVLESLRS